MAGTPLELRLRAAGNWFHDDHRQVAAFLAAGSLIRGDAAAGAVGFEVGPAHGGSVFFGRSSWAM